MFVESVLFCRAAKLRQFCEICKSGGGEILPSDLRWLSCAEAYGCVTFQLDVFRVESFHGSPHVFGFDACKERSAIQAGETGDSFCECRDDAVPDELLHPSCVGKAFVWKFK